MDLAENLLLLLVLLGQLRTILRRRQLLAEAFMVRRRYVENVLQRRRIIRHRRQRRLLNARRLAMLGLGLVFVAELAGHQRRTVWVRQRTTAVWDEMWLTLEADRWREHFRMSRETFLFLVNRLTPILQRDQTRFRQAVSVEKRVAIALWRMATNVEFRTISSLFGVGRSTACKITHEVALAIKLEFGDEFLQFPVGGEQLRNVVNGFEERWGFPQVGGAIDGTHIPITAPQEFPNDYYNRKGHHSIVLQAVVDHQYRFTDVFVGWPGSVHDARVLSNSEIYRRGEDGTLFPRQVRNINGVNVPIVILGDPAYPLLPWLMKGFSDQGRLLPEQVRFNYRLSRARMVVECAFGRLKARWRCLLKRNDSDIANLTNVVIACCILHNICETRGDGIIPQWLNENVENQQQAGNANQGRRVGAEQIRNALVNYFAQENEL